jgi:hypothetical protein
MATSFKLEEIFADQCKSVCKSGVLASSSAGDTEKELATTFKAVSGQLDLSVKEDGEKLKLGGIKKPKLDTCDIEGLLAEVWGLPVAKKRGSSENDGGAAGNVVVKKQKTSTEGASIKPEHPPAPIKAETSEKAEKKPAPVKIEKSIEKLHSEYTNLVTKICTSKGFAFVKTVQALIAKLNGILTPQWIAAAVHDEQLTPQVDRARQVLEDLMVIESMANAISEPAKDMVQMANQVAAGIRTLRRNELSMNTFESFMLEKVPRVMGGAGAANVIVSRCLGPAPRGGDAIAWLLGRAGALRCPKVVCRATGAFPVAGSSPRSAR